MKTFNQFLSEELSRKYYNDIASILKGAKQVPANEQLSWIAIRLAKSFKEDNPRFDMNKFLKAAGEK